MKKIPPCLLTALLFIGLSPGTANAAVKTGAVAPDFTLTDINGVDRQLSDFRGKYVVLEWTNHQCPFVKKFYSKGHMQALQKKMTEKDVVWLQINSGAPGKQGYITAKQGLEIRKKQGHKSTAYLPDSDGTVGRLYHARTTPHMYLINPGGKLIYQGAIDSIKSTKTKDIKSAENFLTAAYDAHKKGKRIKKSTTPPYGCSVKY